MANDLNLNEITYQKDIRSGDLRENFGDIQSEFNSLNSQVQSLVVDSTDNAEVIAAREGLTSLTDNLRAIKNYFDFSNYYVVTGLKVSEDTGSNMKITVSAGNGGINLQTVSSSAVTSGAISAAASGKHRYDAVYIDTSNAVAVTSGAEELLAAAIALPELAASQMMIGYFEVDDSTTAITDAMIVDTRNTVSGGVPTCYNIFTIPQFEAIFGTGTPVTLEDNTTYVFHHFIGNLNNDVTLGAGNVFISYGRLAGILTSASYTMDLENATTVEGDFCFDGLDIGGSYGSVGYYTKAQGLESWKDTSDDSRSFVRTTGKIILSDDTNIYRASANVLKTDDQFQAAGGIASTNISGATITTSTYNGWGMYPITVQADATSGPSRDLYVYIPHGSGIATIIVYEKSADLTKISTFSVTVLTCGGYTDDGAGGGGAGGYALRDVPPTVQVAAFHELDANSYISSPLWRGVINPIGLNGMIARITWTGTGTYYGLSSVSHAFCYPINSNII